MHIFDYSIYIVIKDLDDTKYSKDCFGSSYTQKIGCLRQKYWDLTPNFVV